MLTRDAAALVTETDKIDGAAYLLEELEADPIGRAIVAALTRIATTRHAKRPPLIFWLMTSVKAYLNGHPEVRQDLIRLLTPASRRLGIDLVSTAYDFAPAYPHEPPGASAVERTQRSSHAVPSYLHERALFPMPRGTSGYDADDELSDSDDPISQGDGAASRSSTPSSADQSDPWAGSPQAAYQSDPASAPGDGHSEHDVQRSADSDGASAVETIDAREISTPAQGSVVPGAASPIDSGARTSAQLDAVALQQRRDAYQRIALRLSGLAQRREIRDSDLGEVRADEVRVDEASRLARAALWLAGSSRDGDELSKAAEETFTEQARSLFDAHLKSAQERGGVSVEGIDDETLRGWLEDDPGLGADYPELQAYLNRADPATGSDANTDLISRDWTHEGVAGEFHYSLGDPTAETRLMLVTDGLSVLRRGGYSLPATLNVYAPRYDRKLTVRASTDTADPYAETELHFNIEHESQAGVLSPPDRLFLSPRISAEIPVGKQFENPSHVPDMLAHRGIGVVLHELMHWLHFHNDPQAYMDLSSTEVRGAHIADVGEVSPYAFENPHEFVAEYGVGRLLGRHYDGSGVAARLEKLYKGLGGSLPDRDVGPVSAGRPTDEEFDYLVSAVRQPLARAGRAQVDRGAVVDAEARSAVFDRWRDLPTRAGLVVGTLLAAPPTPRTDGQQPADPATGLAGVSGGVRVGRTPLPHADTDDSDFATLNAIEGWMGQVNADPTPAHGVARDINSGQTALAVFERLSGIPSFQRAGLGTIPVAEMPEATNLVQWRTQPERIAAVLKEEGHGGHTMVAVLRGGDGRSLNTATTAHYFVAYNHHGNLYALDGQSAPIQKWPPDFNQPGQPVTHWLVSVPSDWTSVLPASTAGDVLVSANDFSAGLETGMHQSSVESGRAESSSSGAAEARTLPTVPSASRTSGS